MLLSIITVSYNSERTIKKTIESVLNQPFSDFEYIIIDGDSTDRTKEIIKEYESSFIEKRIRYTWVSEKDKGIYDAMNKGVNMAKGILIGILNSDDWYEPDTLQLVADAYTASKADYIHGNINTFSPSYDFIKLKKPASKKKMIQRMTFFHPASFISKKIYEDLGGYSLKYKICSDYDFILQLIQRNYQIAYVDAVFTNFLYGGVSTSKVKEALKESHIIRVANNYNKYLSKLYYYKSYLICKFISKKAK